MTHSPPLLLRNAHVHTIWTNLTRRPALPPLEQERILTPDGDFLELDWSRRGSRALVILSHGLEGHSRRPYMLGMSHILAGAGFDTLAWSYRGCGQEPNALPRLYHSGCTDDLETVITHALKTGRYDEVHLVGFSMGGNLTLLYLGQRQDAAPEQLKSFVSLSSPCDLNDCIPRFERGMGRVYAENFLITLRQKIRIKAQQFPHVFDTSPLSKIKTLRSFDDTYTAPLHGFDDAVDYWTRCSSRPLIPHITKPGLIINALDDPFLEGGCYPYDEVSSNLNLTIKTPALGGHLAFFEGRERYWSETQTLRFIRAHSSVAG